MEKKYTRSGEIHENWEYIWKIEKHGEEIHVEWGYIRKGDIGYI